MDKYSDHAAPAAFLLFAATLAPWTGNFPLNDDWAYAMAAKTLSETGRLVLCDWGSATQVVHVALGALWAKLFGFGFGALRTLNLLVAAAAVFAFLRLLALFGVGRSVRLAAGLTLALSPLYLPLAASFMTDAHYFFWMTAAVYFYARRLKDPADGRALLWAGLCAAAAYLTRQLAVALPLAYTLVLLLHRRFSAKEAAAAWAAPAAAMAGYALWFKFLHGPTWASENYVGASTLAHLSKPLTLLNDSFYRLFASMAETGLLLLPLAAGFIFSWRKFTGRNALNSRVMAAGPWLALAALAGFAALNGAMPYLENTLSASGLGALTLGGAAFKPSGLFASPIFWTAATAAALLSAVILMLASGVALRSGDPALRFAFLAAALQLCVSLIGAKYFDRYLLPTTVFWFALAAAFAARGIAFHRPAAALALALTALLGWAGMKDYLAWNRAKWELASRVRPGLTPDEIANGFDYDAWHNYSRSMGYLKSMKPLKMIDEWEWQKVIPYKAMISYRQDPKLEVIDRLEYSTPLPPGKGVLYLLGPKRASR